MNLLDELTSILTPSTKAVARIKGQRTDGVWIATTLAGATVLLTGQGAMGKQVYYNPTTGAIVGFAPEVRFERFGV